MKWPTTGARRASPGTIRGLFLAQNMGLVYLGAIPLLLIVAGLVRGVLFERPIRFFTIALVVVLLYALGWYTPAFRVMYEVLPGVSFYRRPADAVFLIGALGAVLAGYVASRLLDDTDFDDWPWLPTTAITVALFGLALIFAMTFDRVGAATLPLAQAAGWFVLAGIVIALARWLVPIRPVVAGCLLVATTAGDVVWNNGPNGASALPSETLAMMNPAKPDPVTAKIKQLIGSGQFRHPPRSYRADRPWLPLAKHVDDAQHA